MCRWVCFGSRPVQVEEGNLRKRDKNCINQHNAAHLKYFSFHFISFSTCCIGVTGSEKVELHVILTFWASWQRERRIWQRQGAMPQHEPFLTFHILRTVGEKTGSTSVSCERYQRWGWGWGSEEEVVHVWEWELECVGERKRERERGDGGEGERRSRLLGTWAAIMVSRMRKHLWISSVIYNKV